MRARLFTGLLPFLASLLAPGLAVAQPPPGGVPLDRLLPEIRRAYPGQFLDAEGVTAGGSPHYHLKWLTPDGRVMWLDADARTGRIQRMAPGRDSFDMPRARAGDAPRLGAEGDGRNDDEARVPDRGFEGRGDTSRFERSPRFSGQRPYPGGDADQAPRGRFGNGNIGGGFPDRGFENRGGGGQRNFGGERPGRDFGGGPRGRGSNRR